jgi:uncharacterized caspase-like protein
MATCIQDLSDRRKLALIIGNGNYHRPENRLNNSIKNAQELTNLLKTINFEVKTQCNRKKHDITMDFIDFSEKVRDGDLIFLYLSGHAYQVSDKNYFIPTDDARIETNRDVEDFAIDIELMLTRLVKKNPSYVTILILDCCRPYVMKGASAATCK